MGLADRISRRISTPLFLQSHITECGAACLGSILGYFGIWVSLNELREKCGISRDGSTAAGILRAAKHYGLQGSGKSVELRSLRKMQFPLILFWEFNHFVVLEGISGDRFFLNDPAIGYRAMDSEEFDKGFTGVALQFMPGPEFQQRKGSRRTILHRLSLWLEGAQSAFLWVVLYAVMLPLLCLVVPAMMVVFVDHLLLGGEYWGWSICGLLAGSGILVFWLALLKQKCLARLAVRISVVAGDRCMSKLLRMPLEFFCHRYTSQLTGCMLLIDGLARGLAVHMAGVLTETVMGTVFFLAMLVYDPTVALAVLGIAAMNPAVMCALARSRAAKSYAWQRERELLLGSGQVMLDSAEIMRMRAEDDSFFFRWAGLQCRELTACMRHSELKHAIAAIQILSFPLCQVAVLGLGTVRVMEGELTLGMLVGLHILSIMFLESVTRLTELFRDRQVLETGLQRLEAITELPEPHAPPCVRRIEEGVATVSGRMQLAGYLEMRNVTFGYNPNRPPHIKDFNLTITPGQRVALVGPSGSGKSTISRLISGVHRPWSGQILLDGLPLEQVPKDVLSRSLSLVDQKTFLFSGTVRDNITLWNPAVPDEILTEAARDACIHEDILNRPLGYATPLDERGSNLSGGQRQRIDIARALVDNPALLLLDEATSALDAVTEKAIDDALRRRGVTCLIVAHRLSTIRDADEIIVLDKGVEVQRGTHETLYPDRSGIYRKLIQEE